MRGSMAGIAAVTAAALLAAPVAAGTFVGWYDRNGNGIADTWLVDDDGNTNTAERMLIDTNENGRAEMQFVYQTTNQIAWMSLDPGEDGGYEITAQPVYNANGAIIGRYLWYDADVNGRYEIGYYDGNLDGYYEYVCVDTDFDGVANYWTYNTAPVGRTATDDLARRVAAANWVRDYQALGGNAFFPTVSVPLP